MSFRGHLRPGQGFKEITVLERTGTTTATGRPYTGSLQETGMFLGIITQVSPTEKEQWKQLGTPITHTILQRGTVCRAKANDVLELVEKKPCGEVISTRRFLVKGDPDNPGELGHFLIYKVEERKDLQ